MKIVRTVRIVSSEEKGPSVSCGEYVDSSPDREEYKLVGVNCTVSEFLEWFLEIDVGNDFCCSEDTLIDIGGSSLDLSIGAILSVSSDDYFSAWLQRTKAWHLNQARIEVGRIYDSLGIEHRHSEPLCLMSQEKRVQTAYWMNRIGLMSDERLTEHVKQCSKKEVCFEKTNDSVADEFCILCICSMHSCDC
jgi:hypothetical protein